MTDGSINSIRLFLFIFTFRFFGSHLSDITESHMKSISTLKLIRLENDKVVTPSTDLYLPLEGYDFGDQSMSLFYFLKASEIIKNSCIKYQGMSNDNIQSFLKKIGLQVASPPKILTNYILPLYKGKQSVELESNLDHLLFIREYFEDFSEKEIQAIKQHVKLMSNSKQFKTPNTLYVSKFYYLSSEPDLIALLPNASYISDSYLEYSWKLRPKNNQSLKEREIEKWRNFFHQLGIMLHPKIEMTERVLNKVESKKEKYGLHGANIEDFLVTEDLKTMISNSPYSTLAFIDYYFNYYKEKFVKVITPSKTIDYTSLSEDSSFLSFLKATKLNASNKQTVSTSEMFYGKEMPSYGNIWPFYLQEIKNKEFLKYLGIEETFTIPTLIKRLRFLKNSKLPDIEIYSQCLIILRLLSQYSTLDFEFEQYVDKLNSSGEVLYRYKKKKRENIKEIFSKEKLIFINKNWYHSNELFWTQDKILFERSDTPSLDSLFNSYDQKLMYEFLIAIGVMKERPLKDVISILKSISVEFEGNELSETAKKNVLEIYYKIDELLERRKEADSANTLWLTKALKEDKIINTTKGMMSLGNSPIFINDSDDLFSKFKDKIAFLDVSDEKAKLENFIRFTKIPRLSVSVKTFLNIDQKTLKDDQEIKMKFKYLLPYIQRYFYHTDYYAFEQLKLTKYFSVLNEKFQAKSTNTKIKTTYSIGDVVTQISSNVKFDHESFTLYIFHNNGKVDNHSILKEIANIFDTPKQKELKSFLFGVFTIDAEEYMKFIGIDEIPVTSKSHGLFDEEDEESVEIRDPSLYDAFTVKTHSDQNLFDKWNQEKKEKMEKQTLSGMPTQKVEAPVSKGIDLLTNLGIQFVAPPPEPPKDQEKSKIPQMFVQIGKGEFKYQFNPNAEPYIIETKESTQKSSKTDPKKSEFVEQFNPFRNIPDDEIMYLPDQETSIKIDEIGMELALSFELSRMKQILPNATIFQNKTFKTDCVFDVSTKTKIFEARKNQHVDNYLKSLINFGISIQSVGFDILTIHPITNQVDRVIELKSSTTMKTKVEISHLEMNSAKILGDLYYLYFIGDISLAKPFGVMYRNPYTLESKKIANYLVDLKSADKFERMKFTTDNVTLNKSNKKVEVMKPNTPKKSDFDKKLEAIKLKNLENETNKKISTSSVNEKGSTIVSNVEKSIPTVEIPKLEKKKPLPPKDVKPLPPKDVKTLPPKDIKIKDRKESKKEINVKDSSEKIFKRKPISTTKDLVKNPEISSEIVKIKTKEPSDEVEKIFSESKKKSIPKSTKKPKSEEKMEPKKVYSRKVSEIPTEFTKTKEINIEDKKPIRIPKVMMREKEDSKVIKKETPK
jgi:hypothetical protein